MSAERLELQLKGNDSRELPRAGKRSRVRIDDEEKVLEKLATDKL